MEEDDFDDLFRFAEDATLLPQARLVEAAETSMPCENEDASMLDYFSEREAGAIDDLIGQMSISSAEANGVHASEVPSREDQDKAATQVDYVAVTSTRQLNDMEGLKDFNRSPASIPENSSVINKIEAVFEQMADDMLNERGELSILLETRRTRPQAVSSRDRKISFPGKTAGEAWRFTVVTRLLEIMHEALLSGVVITKRDMYYRDPALFGSQTHVDRYVDDIALTFHVPRSFLNVTAAAKGLIVGAATFCRKDGSTLNVAADRDGTLVPNLRDILSVNMQSVSWVLVIEKEASFRSIATSAFWPALSQHGVMVTGKGYPDVATRALLHFMTTASTKNGYASPRVFGLVDFDRDGVAILNTYKFGSVSLAHEGPELCVPQMEWLGLRSEHVMLGGEDVHATQGLLALTQRDRKKVGKMLERCEDRGDEGIQDTKRELQRMLILNVKAELQLLHATPNAMEGLLTSALETVAMSV